VLKAKGWEVSDSLRKVGVTAISMLTPGTALATQLEQRGDERREVLEVVVLDSNDDDLLVVHDAPLQSVAV